LVVSTKSSGQGEHGSFSMQRSLGEHLSALGAHFCLIGQHMVLASACIIQVLKPPNKTAINKIFVFFILVITEYKELINNIIFKFM
jgi:hypothetical protein